VTFIYFTELSMSHDYATAPLVNETEAARILDMSVKTLRRWRWAGKELPYHKIGRAVRYDKAELEAYIASARRTSTSDTGPGDIPAGLDPNMFTPHGLRLLRRAEGRNRRPYSSVPKNGTALDPGGAA
jgi:excisionase family DNA binding protein